MKTITTPVYSFDELSDAAKAKALDWYRDGYETDLSMTVEDFKDNIAPLFGFDVSRVFYSGFSSQGDGACFEGTWSAKCVTPHDRLHESINEDTITALHKRMAQLAAQWPEATAEIEHRGHYYHEHSNAIDFDPDQTVPEDEFAGYEEEFSDIARDLMRWLYRQLEKDHEWQLSDEALTDSILAAEYDFTEDGKVFRS